MQLQNFEPSLEMSDPSSGQANPLILWGASLLLASWQKSHPQMVIWGYFQLNQKCPGRTTPEALKLPGNDIIMLGTSGGNTVAFRWNLQYWDQKYHSIFPRCQSVTPDTGDMMKSFLGDVTVEHVHESPGDPHRTKCYLTPISRRKVLLAETQSAQQQL